MLLVELAVDMVIEKKTNQIEERYVKRKGEKQGGRDELNECSGGCLITYR